MSEPEEMTAAWREQIERVRQRVDSPEDHWPNEAHAALDALTTQIEERDDRLRAYERLDAERSAQFKAQATQIEELLAEIERLKR